MNKTTDDYYPNHTRVGTYIKNERHKDLKVLADALGTTQQTFCEDSIYLRMEAMSKQLWACKKGEKK